MTDPIAERRARRRGGVSATQPTLFTEPVKAKRVAYEVVRDGCVLARLDSIGEAFALAQSRLAAGGLEGVTVRPLVLDPYDPATASIPY